MGLVQSFRGHKVFIDTAPLIYYIEGHSKFQNDLNDIFQANESGEFKFITSALTLLEVLIQPMRLGRQDLVSQYTDILNKSNSIDLLEVDIETVLRAAEIRARYNLKTPDSIQLGTALTKKATIFFTNDKRFSKVSDIEVLSLS